LIWEADKFPSKDLLAHVSNYLNPSGDSQESHNSPLEEATAKIWKITDAALRSMDGLGSNADWYLNVGDINVPFKFIDFQMMLFRVGVGFVTVKTYPLSVNISDWLNFIHYFRFAWGGREVSVQAQREFQIDPHTREKEVKDFFPALFGNISKEADKSHTFGELISALLKTGAISDKENIWWCEVFVPEQLLPYSILYIDNMAKESIPRFIYKMQNFFHYNQEIQPASTDLLLEDRPNLLSYADQQWFIFSLEGGAFVAVDAKETQFFRATLPDHLRNQYFLLFLLSLHQRFALISISDDVAKHWLKKEGQDREKAFINIRDRMLAFTARGYFTQVMQREHHHRCYRKWQETFQIKELYQEVSDEVRDLHEYLLTRQSKRVENLTLVLNLAAFIIGPPAIVLSYLDAIGPVSPYTAIISSFVAFLGGAIGFYILRHFSHKEE